MGRRLTSFERRQRERERQEERKKMLIDVSLKKNKEN